MKKALLIAIIAVLAINPGTAQKLVIGSKVPDMKSVLWKSGSPSTDKATYIEFYQSSNPTSVKLYPKLAEIHSRYAGSINIVILTREDNEAIDALIRQDGSGYSFGYDPSGSVYEAFGVKFVPFSMLVDSKGNLLWQGNLSNVTDQILQKAK